MMTEDIPGRVRALEMSVTAIGADVKDLRGEIGGMGGKLDKLSILPPSLVVQQDNTKPPIQLGCGGLSRQGIRDLFAANGKAITLPDYTDIVNPEGVIIDPAVY